MSFCTQTPTSWTVCRKSPSPTTQATWRSGRASFAPIAAGTAQPTAEYPPEGAGGPRPPPRGVAPGGEVRARGVHRKGLLDRALRVARARDDDPGALHYPTQ